MDFTNDFSDNLATLMFDNDLTVNSFAGIIDIDNSLIHKYLRKETVPSVKNFLKIACYFRCSADFLLGLSTQNYKVSDKLSPPFSVCFENALKFANLNRYRFRKLAAQKEISFSKQSVDDWFHGKHEPNIYNVINIAKVLNISIDVLFCRE